jgi:hypothetical protein
MGVGNRATQEQLPRGQRRGYLKNWILCKSKARFGTMKSKNFVSLISLHPTQCFRATLPGTLRALSTRPNPLPMDLSLWRGLVFCALDIQLLIRI